MRERNLSQLTSLELLDLAILAEQEAAERYGEFADQMALHHNVQAAELFRQIQAQEIEHLQRLRVERKRRSDRPVTIESLHFFDPVEAPPYENSHYRMTPAHVFHVALEAERRACAFYQQMMKVLTDREARAMAREFWEEEQRHIAWVEEGLGKLPAVPEDWEEDHDEPVSQA